MTEIKKREEEFDEWFRPQDPEPNRFNERAIREWNIRFFSTKFGYLQACKVREVESSKEIEKLKSLVKRHEEVIREEFGHAITDADEVLWERAK